MYENILFERKDRVAVITLNRPRVLNALSRALKAELSDALRRVRADETIRALVITGAGDRAFSAGQDLNEAKDLDGPGAEEWVREYERLYEDFRVLDIPIVAAVQGWCMGAGCQLALLADIRISADTAQYGMPEIRDGIPAIFGLGLLWNLVGHEPERLPGPERRHAGRAAGARRRSDRQGGPGAAAPRGGRSAGQRGSPASPRSP